MNKRQINALWAGIIIIIIMAMFPPWTGRKSNRNAGFIGFHFVFSQPKYQEKLSGSSYRIIDGKRVPNTPVARYAKREYIDSRIDLSKFLMQLIPVILICGGLICTYTNTKRTSRLEVTGSNDALKQ